MAEKVKLSKRLKTIASYISPNTYFADIGSDHGYLACYICQNDDQSRAIASEVREGPFLRTKETVDYYHLSDRIEVRLGDGLTVLNENDPVTEIVIAGMGGSLITHILEAGKSNIQRVKKIIVQPNNHAVKLRKFFLENHYTLKHETILEENSKIYEILVAEKTTDSQPYQAGIELEKQLLFGPILMKDKSVAFKKKWRHEKEKVAKILTQIENTDENIEKIRSFQRQVNWMEDVLK